MKVNVVFNTLVVFFYVVSASQAEELARPKKMTFSYVNHPVILNELLPIVQEAYSALGIKTEFVEQPSDRNLKAISKGLLDGDVVFSRLLLRDYPELLIIEPPLVMSIFVILCQPTLVCNEQVLFDTKEQIVLTDASHNGLKVWYGDKLRVGFYLINNLATIPQLVSDRRVKYGMYVMSESQLAKINRKDFHYTELFRTKSYHILNPKFGFMKKDVEAAIRQVIAIKNTVPSWKNPIKAETS